MYICMFSEYLDTCTVSTRAFLFLMSQLYVRNLILARADCHSKIRQSTICFHCLFFYIS